MIRASVMEQRISPLSSAFRSWEVTIRRSRKYHPAMASRTAANSCAFMVNAECSEAISIGAMRSAAAKARCL
jgi:hypothetical protein